MKTMIKYVIALMALTLVLFALSGCELVNGIMPKPECEHNFADANCTSPKTCSLCGVTEGEALGHTEEAIAGKDATCTETGLTEGKKCTVCGETTLAQEEIPVIAHTAAVVPGKDATCTETGLTDGKKCSVCDVTILAQEEIPALGHTEEILEGEDATCTSAGLTEGKKCSVCYEILVAQEETALAPHTEEVVPGKDATCTETGLTDGKKCSVCGKTTVEQELTVAIGHKDADGDFECDVCKVDLCTEHLPAEAIEESRVEATCEADGKYVLVVKCSRCGEEISREEKVIGKLGHKEETLSGKDATCTVAGLTEGKKCSVCDKILVAQEEISAPGHKEETLSGKDATCTEAGITEGKKCSVCGEILVAQKEISALGHKEETLSGKDATCTEAGLTEGKKCSVCGEETVPQKVIPPSHAFVDGACSICEVIENIISDKEFIPDESAKSSILVASWWKGGGYETLTDGIKNADNAPGRFATIMKTSGMMDATISLGGVYLLDNIRFYTYEPAAGTGAGSLGKDLLIQVYSNGEWIDVITCEDNAAIAGHLVVVDGVFNDYLQFNLGGIRAEKIRFYISASASASGTSFEEIECSAKVAPHEHSWVDATCAAPKTCSGCGAVEGEALPHNEEIIPAVAQTCTSTGLTEGKKCSVCNTITVKQEVIPMHNLVEGVCADCGYAPNVFAGKVFEPTEEAKASVLTASWWKGSGYKGLTDGIRNADNAPGRFATVMNASAMMDATINLGGTFELYTLRFYTYDPNGETNIGSLGANLIIQVSSNGEWTDVVNCADNAAIVSYLVVNSGDYDDYLEFDLGGIKGEKVRFYISASASSSGTSYEEIECSAKRHVHVHSWKDATCLEPKVCSTCGETEGTGLGHNYEGSICLRCGYERVLIDNIFSGKEFEPTSDALANVLTASWWKGGGYNTLTDGIKNADNAPGRFSTVMKATGMIDATIDLGITYELHSLKIYTYDPAAGTGAGSVGANLLIQVYSNGEWTDAVICADNASIMSHLVTNDGTYNDYLEFDLGGINAEKVRIYVSASASASGTTYEEIECNGYI